MDKMRNARAGGRFAVALAAVMVSLATFPAAAEERWSALVSPDNAFSFSILKGDATFCSMGIVGWGPGWGWVGFGAKATAAGDELKVSAPFVANKQRGEVIDVAYRVRKSGDRSVSFTYDMSAEKDVPLTYIVTSVTTDAAFHAGEAILSHVDGTESKAPLSFGLVGGRPETSKVTLRSKDAGDVVLTLEPPCPIGFDRAMRVIIAPALFKRGRRAVTITVTTPAAVDLLARQSDLDRLMKVLPGPDWYPFAAKDLRGPSVLGLADWLEKPAGARGGVRMVGDRFEFEDGTPVRFWGTNLSYALCAPEKANAEFTAARFEKYGVNGVRLHKFTGKSGWEGIGDPNDSTKMDPAGLDRLDYFFAELKKRGVYAGWSHTFKFQVRPGNRDRLVAYDEIAGARKGDTYAFINFAEDVQDLMIEMVVNLLKHRNPHTGLTYAEDPALSFIEMQNEDDIFFYTSSNALNGCPTYRRLFLARFAKWLEAKYGIQEELANAWEGALKPEETIEKASIFPQLNPWFFGDDHLPGQKGGARRRLLDTAEFLHEAQNRFYARFAKAIRDVGYRGPLVGSPWQAPSMVPHYYNLRSDYLAGYIDRHNYFGGGIFDSMLAKPGSGYFSTGLQQIADRPFGLSEWITVYPSFYAAEGPAMIAAYGMGLQGWDASYEFQSQSAPRVFNDRAGWFQWGVWEADVPVQLGQNPTLARMVLRGDVKESEVISTRRVSLEELREGEFGFSDKVVQRGDVKSFGGSVSPEALAAGRVVVEFTGKAEPSTFPDMARYTQGTAIRSSTGQLVWDRSGKGFFSVDTPGTKAVVGFAEGRTFRLGSVTIRPGCPYASIFLTALEKDATLARAKSALLTAFARNANTGFTYFTINNKVINNGKAPILLEPVKADVTVRRRHVAAVHVLDHDGKRTGRTVEVRDGAFSVEGERDKSPYYEVVFD